MSFNAEFNWVLKIKDAEQLKNLKKGETRTFRKDGNRIFPINMPIFLVDKDLNCLGVVRIKKTVMSGSMEIESSVDEIFEGEKKRILSGVLRDMYG